MRFLKCFAYIFPKKKDVVIPQVIPVTIQSKKIPSVTTVAIDKSLDPISEDKTITTTESAMTNDPSKIETIKTNDTLSTVDTIPEPSTVQPIVKEKLKPASKYTIGQRISPGYLSQNKYYFIKPNKHQNIVLFGKFIEIDKTVKNRAIIRLSDTSDLTVFDYKDFIFFRAIPKKSD